MRKFGVIVESIMQTLYPARSSGVDTARSPRGAVASWLENAGKKKTTFLDRMLFLYRCPSKAMFLIDLLFH